MIYKRPLCLFCLSFMAGISLAYNFSLSFTLVLSAISFLTLVITYKKYKRTMLIISAALFFFTAGSLLYNNSEKQFIYDLKDYYGKSVILNGYIDSEIERDGDKIKFTFKETKALKSKLLVIMYNSRGSQVSFDKEKIGYRTRLSFQGVINRPKGATNPGGFNYQRYLASLGISGTVNIFNSEVTTEGIEQGGMINRLGYGIKNRVLGIVEYCLSKNQAGLLAGMIIGYKDGLDENAFEAFSKAGLTHIMVASGMNVAFIILPLLFLFKRLNVGNRASGAIAIFVLILFVFVTGFSASVVRAVIMGIIILVGKIIMREPDIYTSISAAALIILIINPFIIFDIGFQLSFGATLSLVMFYPVIKVGVSQMRIPEIISDTLAATLAAQIGVIPITLYYFNSLSIISVISNLLVVPMVQIITIIGFIMVFAGLININLAVLIGYINNTFLSFVLFVTETSSKVPFASIKLPTPPMWMIITYYVWIIYMFIARERLNRLRGFKKVKWAVVILLAASLLIVKIIPKPIEITFLDVGQGDGAFIRTAHGTKVLIDGGGREAGSKSSFDIGKSVMVPYILDTGTKSIDIVIASHGHSDHTEGLEAVLEEIKVEMLVLPDTDGNGFEKLKNICTGKGIKIELCKKGDIIKLDNETRFEVMNPLEFSMDELSQQSLNNSSLVLKLIYKKFSVLFTGDSEIPVEERLVGSQLNLQSDLIKVGHHGSTTSSSTEFIERINPGYAVISVGEHNKFGHPSQFVVDRLTEKNIKLYRTDESGAVTVKSYGRGLKVSTMLPYCPTLQ